jgi:phosphoglycolate phosphatase-like HAD superfamily hydrolase
VGDSPWDGLAASRLGLPVVGFRCGGFPEAELVKAGARQIFDGPADLLAHLDRSPFGDRR